MSGVARAWFITLVVSAGLTLLIALLARLWRRDDVESWHRVYCALAATSLLAPVATWLLPAVRVVWHSGVSTALPAVALNLSPRTWSWLGAACVLGILGSLVHLAFGLAVVRQLRRSARVPDAVWAKRLALLEGVDASRCRVHRRVQSPMAVGILAPLVILPENAIFWSDARLRAVLEHEFAHVRRADYFWNLVAACHRAVYWPSPLAWWLVKRARLTAELACDRHASTTLGDASYAQILVQSAREFIAAGEPGLVVPRADTDLFARLEALLRMDTRQPSRASGEMQALLVGAIVAVLLTAAVVRVDALAPGHRPYSSHSIRHLH